MIRLLIAMHPRLWRARYGEEFRALLENGPLTPAVVLDVLRNAARLHASAHAGVLRIAVALWVSSVAEIFAVRWNLTDNILWVPSTPSRALALAVVVLPWLPVFGALSCRLHSREPTGAAGAQE
jgi:hypothetical protein